MVKQVASLILLSLVVVVMGFASSSNLHAQELTEFSDTVWVYYEDERPNSLDAMLWFKNLCLEAVIKLNPNLDWGNITYGTQLLLPESEPCYFGSPHYYNSVPEARLKYYENSEWLVEPYYSDDFVYASGASVEEIAEELNVCVADLLADNILLQDFDAYKAFSTWSSFDVFIPQDAEPCNPEASVKPVPITISLSSQLVTPLMMTEMFNICPEEFPSYIWMAGKRLTNRSASSLTFSPNVRPCYNDNNERLIYFDEFGRKLDEPYYSNLSVFIAEAGITMSEIAEEHGLCLNDLLRINGFPELPLIVDIELFAPPKRPCDEMTEAIFAEVGNSTVDDFSMSVNVCSDQLLAKNPQLNFTTDWGTWIMPDSPYRNLSLSHNRNYLFSKWIFVPKDAPVCYHPHIFQISQSVYEIEQFLNVCHEEFRWRTIGYSTSNLVLDKSYFYIPNDAQPCYNEQGQRLIYPPNYTTDMRVRLANPVLEYSPLKVHKFAATDNVYSISKQYNVCVRDLLSLNLVLKESMDIDLPVFIPDTRPCYDTSTGMPLIYEDSDGEPLSTPQVANKLMYFGGQALGHVSYLYNVCQNRIQDANQDKIDGKVSYLGWIIPTDRPPCYDDQGIMIDYACYDQLVDFSVDYRASAEPVRLNVDGANCYDLADLTTIIWHNNQPYGLVRYNGNLLESRAFTAWCYGVSLEEINAINNDPQVLAILPLKTRLIPQPTRECYLDKPELVDATHTVHVVQYGDTLSSIARQYDKLGFWIASENQLDAQNTVWMGQVLLIPDGITMTQTALIAGGVACLGGLVVWRKRRAKSKRKRKNDEGL